MCIRFRTIGEYIYIYAQNILRIKFLLTTDFACAMSYLTIAYYSSMYNYIIFRHFLTIGVDRINTLLPCG